jgi:hypothetical protein
MFGQHKLHQPVLPLCIAVFLWKDAGIRFSESDKIFFGGCEPYEPHFPATAYLRKCPAQAAAHHRRLKSPPRIRGFFEIRVEAQRKRDGVHGAAAQVAAAQRISAPMPMRRGYFLRHQVKVGPLS